MDRASHRGRPSPGWGEHPQAAASTKAKRPKSDDRSPVVSFTRLEIPKVEVYETAVMFGSATDPIAAHAALSTVFGGKAGEGRFQFRADSSIADRYWVRSTEPWTRWPDGAISALEPKREVIQLAEGLMYRFSLAVCAGREHISGGEKRVVAFETKPEVESWLMHHASDFGIRLLLFNIGFDKLRFVHAGQPYKIAHAVIEGALEVDHPDRLAQRLLKGIGSHRRVGLGMLQLSSG
jgi:hypothetical protein